MQRFTPLAQPATAVSAFCSLPVECVRCRSAQIIEVHDAPTVRIARRHRCLRFLTDATEESHAAR